MNGTAHIGNGTVIDNSAVGVKDGKIVLVVNALVAKIDTRQFDTIIDIAGKHIYPGIIAPNSTIGLIEVEAVRATADFNETGAYNPNVRSQISYNTDSKVIPTVRSNGVLLTQCTPRGGVISGTSSIMKLTGWNWEDATIKADDGIHINWPGYSTRGEGDKNAEYNKRIDELKTFLNEARAYTLNKEATAKDLRFEAFRDIFNGKANLYLHADYVKELTDAINLLCRDLKIEKVVIVGGYDSWKITDMLKENKVSVMLRRIHELPMSEEEPVDLPFRIPSLLQNAGVLYCLQNAGDQEAANARNLPFQAGTCVAYGLTKEQALQAITLNAAKILGIEKICGSLEMDKDATLFISSGDALDMKSNNVIFAYIRGEKVNLDNHQKQLYQKFMNKYQQK